MTWPTDLNINRDHLLIKDYLPTKFEACRTKHCWVISCTRFWRSTWPLTFTFDLLTWISIGIIYSSRIIYLPSLKLLVQSFLELSLGKVKGDRHKDQHDIWPTDLNIHRDHLLIKDYLPTKFEASGGKVFLIYHWARLRETDIPTDGTTDRHVQRNMPSFFKGGITIGFTSIPR